MGSSGLWAGALGTQKLRGGREGEFENVRRFEVIQHSALYRSEYLHQSDAESHHIIALILSLQSAFNTK